MSAKTARDHARNVVTYTGAFASLAVLEDVEDEFKQAIAIAYRAGVARACELVASAAADTWSAEEVAEDVRSQLLTCTECSGDGEIGCAEPCECPDEVCWACRGSGVAK